MAKYLDNSGLAYLWAKIKAAFVSSARTVNNKALSADITLTAADVGALPLTGGTMTGTLTASDVAVGTSAVRNIVASTTDLTAGTSALATGRVYFVYE